MVNKPKRQGTAFETSIVQSAQAYQLDAERIAEGGSNDLGDIRINTDTGDFIIEAKHRDRLNIHDALQKTREKAKPTRAAVIWKRSTRKKGNTKRSMVGVPIVAMDLETFFELIGGEL